MQTRLRKREAKAKAKLEAKEKAKLEQEEQKTSNEKRGARKNSPHEESARFDHELDSLELVTER